MIDTPVNFLNRHMPPKVQGKGRGKSQGLELDNVPPTAGDGIFVHEPTESRYEGQWFRFDSQIKRHGTGHYEDSGCVYKGQFFEDKYHGFGEFTAVDGSKYVGEWKNGLMSGNGTYTWPDGAKFTGRWENGKIEGPGTYTDEEGQVWTGVWKDGESMCANLPIA